MQADGLDRDRRIALVLDQLAVDKPESTQGRYGFVQSLVRERRRERRAELFARFGEQEQWDRLRREQRGTDDKRLGGGMELGPRRNRGATMPVRCFTRA
jgi:hypothetical protein